MNLYLCKLISGAPVVACDKTSVHSKYLTAMRIDSVHARIIQYVCCTIVGLVAHTATRANAAAVAFDVDLSYITV